jgi:hypothetical protein
MRQGRPGQGQIILLVAIMGVIGLPTLCTAATAPGIYSDLQPDVFMRRWLILKSIPIAGTAKSPPDEQTQAKAFAQDWLAGSGGEAAVRPKPGLKQTIGGRQFEWQPVESPRNAVDLKAGSNPDEYAVAYASAEIDMPRATKVLLGIGSDGAIYRGFPASTSRLSY